MELVLPDIINPRNKSDPEYLADTVEAFLKETDIPKRDALFADILEGLSSYIRSLLYTHYETYYRRYKDDMEQEAAIAIFKCLSKYDRKKGCVSTFVKHAILHSAFEYVSTQEEVSIYCNRNVTKILNYAKASGKEIQKLDIHDIVTNTDIPMTTAEKCLSRIQARFLSDEPYTLDEIPDNDFEENIMKAEERNIVQSCVKKLPKSQREIVAFYYGFYDEEELSFTQISKQLGISVKTAKRHMAKARNSLYKELSKQCVV